MVNKLCIPQQAKISSTGEWLSSRISWTGEWVRSRISSTAEWLKSSQRKQRTRGADKYSEDAMCYVALLQQTKYIKSTIPRYKKQN